MSKEDLFEILFYCPYDLEFGLGELGFRSGHSLLNKVRLNRREINMRDLDDKEEGPDVLSEANLERDFNINDPRKLISMAETLKDSGRLSKAVGDPTKKEFLNLIFDWDKKYGDDMADIVAVATEKAEEKESENRTKNLRRESMRKLGSFGKTQGKTGVDVSTPQNLNPSNAQSKFSQPKQLNPATDNKGFPSTIGASSSNQQSKSTVANQKTEPNYTRRESKISSNKEEIHPNSTAGDSVAVGHKGRPSNTKPIDSPKFKEEQIHSPSSSTKQDIDADFKSDRSVSQQPQLQPTHQKQQPAHQQQQQPSILQQPQQHARQEQQSEKQSPQNRISGHAVSQASGQLGNTKMGRMSSDGSVETEMQAEKNRESNRNVIAQIRTSETNKDNSERSSSNSSSRSKERNKSKKKSLKGRTFMAKDIKTDAGSKDKKKNEVKSKEPDDIIEEDEIAIESREISEYEEVEFADGRTELVRKLVRKQIPVYKKKQRIAVTEDADGKKPKKKTKKLYRDVDIYMEVEEMDRTGKMVKRLKRVAKRVVREVPWDYVEEEVAKEIREKIHRHLGGGESDIGDTTPSSYMQSPKTWSPALTAKKANRSSLGSVRSRVSASGQLLREMDVGAHRTGSRYKHTEGDGENFEQQSDSEEARNLPEETPNGDDECKSDREVEK